jgi:2-keto-4-pentenoate hydratase/2-oxohepta-3-ene-1,7-dioic acid hydratase in catechol pathway
VSAASRSLSWLEINPNILQSCGLKIVRHLNPQGTPSYAELLSDGTSRQLQGDPLHGFHSSQQQIPLGKILAPLIPTQILCIGINYRHHANETNSQIPEYPILFIKSISSLQNPGDPIFLPRHLRSDRVDYECELAVVIGRTCKNVPASRALDFVLGYTCANDVSARDWQKNAGGGQWCRGKTFDTFCPVGPCIVTPDEIPDPQNLKLRTLLNGIAVQDWSTNDMIFSVAQIIEFLSGSTTLLPGTVILTGTPHGVGMAAQPPRWLKPGDIVTIEIEKIGSLTNPVLEEELH